MHSNAPNYPETPGQRACIRCAHFGGWAAYFVAGVQIDGALADCRRDSVRFVHPAPNTGCVFWMREIGADDE